MAPQTYALAHHSNNFYYFHERTLYVVDLVEAFNGRESGTAIAALPDYASGILGGISVDAEEKFVYIGASFSADAQGLIACAPATGQFHWIPVVQGGARAGQPPVTRRIMYCCETGGDAPQRMWTVDVHGMMHRPFFQESYGGSPTRCGGARIAPSSRCGPTTTRAVRNRMASFGPTTTRARSPS